MTDIIRYIDTDVIGGISDGSSLANAYNSMAAWSTAEATTVATGDRHLAYFSGAAEDAAAAILDLAVDGWLGTGELHLIGDSQDYPTTLDETKYVWKGFNNGESFRAGVGSLKLVLSNLQRKFPDANMAAALHVQDGADFGVIEQLHCVDDFTGNTANLFKNLFSIGGTTNTTGSLTRRNTLVIGTLIYDINANYNSGGTYNTYNTTIESVSGTLVVVDTVSTINYIDTAIGGTFTLSNKQAPTLTNCATEAGLGVNPVTITDWNLQFEDLAGSDFTLSQSSTLLSVGSTGNNIGVDQVTVLTDPAIFTSFNTVNTAFQTEQDIPLVFADFSGAITSFTIGGVDHFDLLSNIISTGATLQYIRALSVTLGSLDYAAVISDGTSTKGITISVSTTHQYLVPYGLVDDNGLFAGVTITNPDAVLRVVTAPTNGTIDWLGSISNEIDDVFTPDFGYVGSDSVVIEIYDPSTNITSQGTITFTIGSDQLVISNPIATVISSTEADLEFTTSEGNGTAYFVVTDSATAPSYANLIVGNDHNGSLAEFSDSVIVTSVGSVVTSSTGLVPASIRYFHTVQDFLPANNSNILSSGPFSLSDNTSLVILKRNPNENNFLMGEYPNGNAPVFEGFKYSLILDDVSYETIPVVRPLLTPPDGDLWITTSSSAGTISVSQADSVFGSNSISLVREAGGSINGTLYQMSYHTNITETASNDWNWLREVTPGWELGRVNRMRLWYKAPIGITRKDTALTNYHVGTFLRDAVESRLNNESGNNHYYHYFNIGYEGNMWQQLIVDSHPSHKRSANGDTEQPTQYEPFPATDPGKNYFDNMVYFYVQQNSEEPDSYPVEFLFDGFEPYEDPYDEDIEQIYSLSGVYNDITDEILVSWKRDKRTSSKTFDVRYAFTSFHKSGGFGHGTAAPNGTGVQSGSPVYEPTGYNGVDYRNGDIDIVGKDFIFIAIQHEDSPIRFREIRIPLTTNGYPIIGGQV